MTINKLTGLLGTAALALGLLSGCGAQDDRPLEPVGEELRIEIGGDDRMQFDVTAFEVHPQQPVTIVFINKGSMPKESMGHNLVVLQRDVDVVDFANTSGRHVRNEYIDPEKENQVIAATRILGPGEREEISFVAPRQTGEYPFVCTFPGHTQAGMRGVMTVRE